MMSQVVISGSGFVHGGHCVSNDALVKVFNRYVDLYNEENSSAIDAGRLKPRQYSNPAYISKHYGIESRHFITTDGILDPEVMMPLLKERPNTQPSLPAELALNAAEQALDDAHCDAGEIELVIVASSEVFRLTPQLAAEVQHFLGGRGYGFDLNMGDVSGLMALAQAKDAISSGRISRALVVTPEIGSAQLNFRDRHSHFSLGDGCCALVVERESLCRASRFYRLLNNHFVTLYSDNICNQFGVLGRSSPDTLYLEDKWLSQRTRARFSELPPLVSTFLTSWLVDRGLDPAQLGMLWLQQSSAPLNQLIAQNVLCAAYDPIRVPSVLEHYGDLASAGVLAAYHHHKQLHASEFGVLAAFGGGYNLGAQLVECCEQP